jgi:NADH:ubiquinone oxidoreductase subunit E
MADRPLRAVDPLLADRLVGKPEQQDTALPSVPAGWDEAADIEKPAATIPELSEVDISPELKAEIEAHLAKYPQKRSAALPALMAAQRAHGWCSPEAIREVAAVMQVTPAYLSSLATFYDMFNTEPVGRHQVYVCTSVACNLRNAQALLEALQEAGGDYDDANIRGFECLGACDMAPMASIDGRYVGPIDPAEAPDVIEALKRGEKPLPGRGLGDEGFKLPWEDGQGA